MEHAVQPLGPHLAAGAGSPGNRHRHRQTAAGRKAAGGRDLALQFSINPNTAARVYQELEKKGLCSTRRGMGTYVTEDTARIFALREEIAGQAVCQFLDTMELLGISRHEAAQWLLKKED